jgi:nanoRNase/pAp phosphatase (c-di-AMP/oligoRNAs hydrolase)
VDGGNGGKEDGMPPSLDALLAAVEGAPQVLILSHTNPDPDAIASAVALRYLLQQELGMVTQIGYSGVIGRAENRALVRFLRRPMRRLASADLREEAPIALVDTQPGASNNVVSGQMPVAVVIDHHPLAAPLVGAAFNDIRPEIGSTSTILTGYLRAARVALPPMLATALFYGIKSDTLGLVRGASPADIEAYRFLQPQINADALLEIEQAQVPAAYFQHLAGAVQAARVYGDVVIVTMGPLAYPDLAAEMADMLLRLEGVQWCVCMGVYCGVLMISVRSRNRRGSAAELALEAVGADGVAGGHAMLAGGQVPLQGQDIDALVGAITRRVLRALAIAPDTPGVALASTPGALGS